MELNERIFLDLRNYLKVSSVIGEDLVSEWLQTLAESESAERPYIKTDNFITFEVYELWKKIKEKICKELGNETSIDHLDQLLVIWAKKIFVRTQKRQEEVKRRADFLRSLSDTLTGSPEAEDTDIVRAAIYTGELIENIHKDLRQFINPENKLIPKKLVDTWMMLLLENEKEKYPMTIPDDFISDSMLDVWMELKMKSLDKDMRYLIDKVWTKYARLLSFKNKKQKEEEFRRSKYIQSKGDSSSYSAPILLHSTAKEVVPSHSETSSLLVNSSVTPIIVPLLLDFSPMSTSNTPASVSSVSSVSDSSPMSTSGSPDHNMEIQIHVVDKLGNKAGVFQYQKLANGRVFCLTGDCVKEEKRKKRDGFIPSTLKDHARQEHSFKIDLRTKSGTVCSPLKCPICHQKLNRKQILTSHLRSKNLHQNFKLDEETIQVLVRKALEDSEVEPNATDLHSCDQPATEQQQQVNDNYVSSRSDGAATTQGALQDIADFMVDNLPSMDELSRSFPMEDILNCDDI